MRTEIFRTIITNFATALTFSEWRWTVLYSATTLLLAHLSSAITFCGTIFKHFSPAWIFFNFRQFIWCQNVQTFLSFNFQHKDFWVKLNPAAQLFKAPEEIANSLKSNQRKSLHPSTDIFIYHFGERSRPTKVLGLFAIWLSCWYPSNVLLLICKC